MSGYIKAILFVLLCAFPVVSPSQEQRRIISGGDKDSILVRHLIHRSEELMPLQSDSAVLLLSEALKISYRNAYYRGMVISLYNLAIYYHKQEQFSQAKTYLLQILPLHFIIAGEMPMLAPRLYNLLGIIAGREGFQDSAARYYYYAIRTFSDVPEAEQDSSVFILLYSNLGISLIYQKQEQQCFYYLDRAISLSSRYGDSAILAVNYQNKGLVYHAVGKYDSAIQQYRQSLAISRRLKSTRELRKCYYYLGLTSGKTGQIDPAIKYFDSALAADPAGAAADEVLQAGIADVYFSRKEYLKAIPYYRKSIEIAYQKGVQRAHLNSFYTLAESYWHTGQPLLAYPYLKTYLAFNDTIYNKERSDIVNRMEYRYRAAEQKKELSEKKGLILQQQNKILQKNVWIGGITLGSVLIVTLLMVIYSNVKHKQKLQEAYFAQTQQRQHEQRVRDMIRMEEQERNRIANMLHDGIASVLAAARMNLGTVGQDGLTKQDIATYRNALLLLDEAYSDIRQTAHNLLTPARIMEEGLLATTEQYCKKISNPGIFHVLLRHYGAMPELSEHTALFLFRIIQELIHNALKHGRASEVTVTLGREEEVFKITVEDNGSGMSSGRDAKTGEGIGLNNLATRMSAIGGSLEIDSREGTGTTVYLVFELSMIC